MHAHTHAHTRAPTGIHSPLYSRSIVSARVVVGTCAAGASWAVVTASAPWAARWGHTSVVDATGNIYVLGGGYADATGAYTYYNDVWQSADQGEAPHRCADACVRACARQRPHTCARAHVNSLTRARAHVH